MNNAVPNATRRLLVITPCRNEVKYARRTLKSVTSQTQPPSLWIIVDDGSTDETPDILAEYARRYDYIRIVRRDDRGTRSVGPGVVDAFYAGLNTVPWQSFTYLAKLDLDLELPRKYFETILERMDANPRIGTCSGKPYYEDPTQKVLVKEDIGDDVSVGASKFYRTSCFQQIGGLVREVMWDGIDCHRCRMFGWIACSWNDSPDLRFVHLRPMGSSQQGILTGRRRHGRGQYFMGTGLTYMTASAIRRIADSPILFGAAVMWWGYLSDMVGRKPRYDDGEFRRFLKRYQWLCLTRGKKRATRMTHGRMASRWTPDAERVPAARDDSRTEYLASNDRPSCGTGLRRSPQNARTP